LLFMVQCYLLKVYSYVQLLSQYKTSKEVPLWRIERRPLVVITLDKNKRPLGWCKPNRASGLIKAGRAVVYKYYPFTIILKGKDARTMDIHHNYRIKIDPGSRSTGVSVVEYAPDGNATVILYTQLEHRGEKVVSNLRKRKSNRRNRRTRETWYRHCKFPKGCAPTVHLEGWLPPSQHSIVDNTVNFVNKLIRLLGPCNVTIENVKFDNQLLENPDIEGKEYQHGTLYGYELKAYLIEKYACTCQYCNGMSGDRRLEWEHKIPKSRGGSDSIKNATLACCTCNSEKNNRTPEEWHLALQAKSMHTDLEKAQLKGIENVIVGKPICRNMRYAAWANSTRKYLVNSIRTALGVNDLELTTGSRTAYNRHVLGYEKDHHLDALVAGKHNPTCKYKYDNQPILYIKAMGRGKRLRGKANKCGIITVKYRKSPKRINGVQTGDIVRAVTPSGKFAGIFMGRIRTRTSGFHDICCKDGSIVTTTKRSSIKILQPVDGYQYRWHT